MGMIRFIKRLFGAESTTENNTSHASLVEVQPTTGSMSSPKKAPLIISDPYSFSDILQKGVNKETFLNELRGLVPKDAHHAGRESIEAEMKTIASHVKPKEIL